jgi:hypothetical protein
MQKVLWFSTLVALGVLGLAVAFGPCPHRHGTSFSPRVQAASWELSKFGGKECCILQASLVAPVLTFPLPGLATEQEEALTQNAALLQNVLEMVADALPWIFGLSTLLGIIFGVLRYWIAKETI